MKNRRGDALLSVVIAMATVGILGVLICSVAYSNFNMKYIDKKAKDNFYSAESVLDDICAKLEDVMSLEYAEAYSSVVGNYGIYRREGRQAQMTDDLVSEFIAGMADTLSRGEAANTKYRFENIGVFNTVNAGGVPQHVFFNSADYPAGAVITVESVYGNNTARYALEMFEQKDGRGNVTDEGLILRNVSVTYEYNGFANNIVTDIRISAPRVNFSEVSSAPDIAGYSFIAQEGVKVTANSEMILRGRAFAGSITLDGGTSASSLTEFDASSEKASLLISGGDITLGNFASFTTGTDTQLWAENISTEKVSSWNTTQTENCRIELLGSTYVADDISLNGPYSSLILGGRYYGYGTGDGQNASAIIINGQHSSVDMSGLTSLMIAGTGYISASGEDSSNTDIPTGESVAVKGNQIAYLVPSECLGGYSNPMDKSDYDRLVSSDSWKNTAVSTRIKGLGRAFSDYGCTASDIAAEFKTGTGGDRQVYIFIKFSGTSVAAEYFTDVCGSASQTARKVKKYLDTYLDTFRFSTDTTTRIVTDGNYLVQASGEKGTYKSRDTTSDGYLNEIKNYEDIYASLCRNLQTGGSAAADNVYDNTVSSQKVAAASVNVKEDGVTLVVTGGNYDVSSDGKGVIIAAGNVNVKNGADWTGIIICGGTLTVTNATGSVFTCDETVTDRALSLSTGMTDTPYGYNFLIGSENYGISGQSVRDSITDIRQCLSFENYTSQ